MEETTISVDEAMLQHFAEHRPHLGPFNDFNELTLDTGMARVTRQADGTLLVSGSGASSDNMITVVQWQNRLHINYKAWVGVSFQCFKALLSSRFCKSNENHVGWRLFNMFDDEAYMQKLMQQQQCNDLPPPLIDHSLIEGHPWHANVESYVPLSDEAVQLWYVPGEWAERLNAMPGPQRNELLQRHSNRVEALALATNHLTHDEKKALCAEVARIHAHELEQNMTTDIASMKRWAFDGFCEMVGRANRTCEYLRQLDEGRLVAASQWTLPPPCGNTLFINMHPSTSLTLCNDSKEPWLLKGCGDYNGPLGPSHSVQFECDERGRMTRKESSIK